MEEKLQDPGKFITLDAKLSAALTCSAKGDLETKIHNFKDEKSKNGIQVRGRRVLLMFEDCFRTSEEAGSLYRVEDLLGVVRTGESVEDLRRFLNRWDATIAGMETPPDDLVLRDIFHDLFPPERVQRAEAFQSACSFQQSGSSLIGVFLCLNDLECF